MNYSDTELSEEEEEDDDVTMHHDAAQRKQATSTGQRSHTTLSNEDDDDDLGIALIDEPVAHAHRQRDALSQDDFHQEVLSQDEIVAYMNDIIREVTSVVQIPGTTARMLLNHFKWDREKLMEAYYDSSSPEKLFREAHIACPLKLTNVTPATGTTDPSNAPGCSKSGGTASSTVSTQKSTTSTTGSTSTSSSSSGTSTEKKSSTTGVSTRSQQKQMQSSTSPFDREAICLICLSPALNEGMTGLECGHRFCSTCWVQYLTTKIMDEGMGQTISCAAYDCDILVDDATVMRLIMDKKVRARYQHLITNSFVECNRLLRWCPSPDCSNAIKVQYADTRPVLCKCGLTFCFTCGHEWHDPVKCKILRKWIKKCSDDSETSNWIAANTKECPKCHVTIEKDGGCNHMTCKSQTCKWEFCWVCLGPWEPHGSTWYSCNRFDDMSSKAARDAQERSRAALQRYLHYCNRYMNHMQSLKFENKLYATAKTRMEQMQQHNMSWIEVQFLRKAIDVLCQCRRTLMYTYVFAYYLKKNNQTIIFEDNQQDLEIATEQLSEFLERDLEKEILTSMKQKVQDKYRYCENRRKVLLDHCHEGDEKDWWVFTE